jgi:hypothetical protein
MNIKQREQAPGGFIVTIEVTNAYTDGSSRFERVFVADDAVRGKSLDEVRQAVKDAVDDDPIAGILGETVSAPTQTKAILWQRAKALYADWQMAKTTRIEAQARSMAAGVITALQNAEDARWTAYTTTLNSWRLAP